MEIDRDALRVFRDALSRTISGHSMLVSKSNGSYYTQDGSVMIRKFRSDHPGTDATLRLIQDACSRMESSVGILGAETALLVLDRLLGRDAPCVRHSDAFLDASLLLSMVSPRVHSPDAAEAIVDAILTGGENAVVRVKRGVVFGVKTEYHSGCLVEADAAYQMGRLPFPIVAMLSSPLIKADLAVSVLEAASEFPDNPLIIISPMCAGHAKAILDLNAGDRNKKGETQSITHLSTFSLVDQLDDLEVCSGGTIFTPLIHPMFSRDHLGLLDMAEISRTESMMVSSKQDAIAKQVEKLRNTPQGIYDWGNDRTKQRIASLDGGLVSIGILCPSDAETKHAISMAYSAVRFASCALKGVGVFDSEHFKGMLPIQAVELALKVSSAVSEQILTIGAHIHGHTERRR